ncbi:MAG: 50S ribosomal protein L18Ae [Candidatus Hodarchaeales archaeon]|jgi:ribosomal protein L20A (L18A)
MSNEVVIRYYHVKGTFLSKGEKIKFSRDIRGCSLTDVREKIMTFFGSKHRVKRHSIKIDSIEEIKHDEVTNTSILSLSDDKDFKLFRG